MKARTIRTLAFGSAAICVNAHSYDAETHGLITYQAYKNSALHQTGSGSLINRLGLDRLDVPLPFHIYWNSAQPIAQNPDSYIDAASLRQPNEYERCQLQNLEKVEFFDINDSMLSGGTVSFFPIQNWLLRGALREDDLTHLGYIIAHDDCGEPEHDPNGPINRVMNHFYDPINDVALKPPLVSCSATAPNGICSKSVDWALGYVNSFATPPVIDTNRRNHFTYEDARQNMWLALTGQPNRPGTSPNTETASQREVDAIDRYFGWATVFRSLGDTIHLLEDGAQPQHVRNDPHGPILTSGEQQAFEGYTNARVLQNNAKVNSYVHEFFALPTNISLPPIVIGTYPVLTFSTPLRFFTTRLGTDSTNPSSVNADSRYGLMDYTNRGFFTGGTLPNSTGVDFVEPSPTIDSTYTAVPQPCVAGASLAGIATHLTCTHFTHVVPDNVDAGYTDIFPQGFTQPPLLLQSAWSQVVPGSMIPRPNGGYMVGLEEFQTMANLTIPRAIGYSAGLIDFFFRGTIQVDSPQDGLFGLVDHALAHSADADGYPHCTATVPGAAGEPDFCTANSIYGFTKIRLKIRNNTPAIVESGTGTSVAQTLSATSATPAATDPQLVAVARYHRNLCYTPSLSGEAVVDYQGNVAENNCAAGNRSNYQEISVSKPLAIPAANLNGSSSYAVAFDFSSDPIPINATDLFIQVVYRGPLGDEPDGIAIGMIDVSEPTYLTLWNDSDYAGCNGAWVTGNAPGCGFANGIGRAINNAYLCIGGQSVYVRYAAGGNGTIYLGKFVRLAALLDNQQHTTKATLSVGTGNTAAYIRKAITGQSRQAPMEIETAQQPYMPDAMFTKRGMIGSFRPMPLYQQIGADPQPANDAGALDVGALTPAFATVLPFGGGTMNFLNTPANPVPTCTN